MVTKLIPNIADLLNEPEKTLKEKSWLATKTFGQGAGFSSIVFIIMWCLTNDINLDEALKMIVNGALALIGLTLFEIFKYFHDQIHDDHKYLVEIARKHKDAQEKLVEVSEENIELKEALLTQVKELNRAIIELACEKQKDYIKEKIVKEVEEAIDNANRRCE